MTHQALAQHFYLDALDLYERFHAHWESQPRKSSRVKSFIDLRMACECMLKAKCVVARQHLPLFEAYKEVKDLGHRIQNLASQAQRAQSSTANERAVEYFDRFGVGLRYSVDAYEYFFPVARRLRDGRRSYASTLGDADWMNEAKAVVVELLEWGSLEFNGEVGDDIEAILLGSEEIEAAIKKSGRKKQRSKAGVGQTEVPDLHDPHPTT